MKIRLNGTREECDAYVTAFRNSDEFEVLDASGFYPWTRRDPLSKLGAVYVTLELPRGAVVQATAERVSELPAGPRRRSLRR